MALAKRPDAVHVAGHQMSPQAVPHLQCAFQVAMASGEFSTQSRAAQGLRRDIHGKEVSLKRNHRQTGAVDGDAFPQGQRSMA